MDSITQIVLGAAMGEAALGKKVGNRAMLWGAVGGTIPDLDVLGNFMMDEIGALAFHRAISHSFFFACTAPVLLGWLTWKFYQSGVYRRRWYKALAAFMWLLLLGLIGFGINYIPVGNGGGIKIPLLLITIFVLALFAWTIYKNYYRTDLEEVRASWRDWGMVFFWSIFTHPILDSFTPFGTQLFQPFHNYRVAFNNIAVVDPIYTVPFLICLVVAAWLPKESPRRRFWNWLGIALSSAYMLFTLYHKWEVNRIFEKSLAEKNITYQRYMTSPTIFNNILWQGMAEGDTAYYHGMYSFMDETPEVIKFSTIPKNHHLIAGHENDRAIRILKWFSNNYYNVIRRQDGALQLNDLRYGSAGDGFEKETDYIFRFILEEKDGQLDARQTREGSDVSKEAFQKLWNRIRGQRE